MSLIVPRICPVLGCKFNTQPKYADVSQIKRHIKYDHDYREKQQTAYRLGLISAISDNRSPTWLIDSLSDFTKIGELY